MQSPDPRLETLLRLGPATIYEAQGQKGAIDPRIAAIDSTTRVAGRALTVDAAPGDNLILHYAVTKARPGDILVVDSKGHTDVAVWGDILTFAAMKAGIAGLVIDGAARDAAAIVEAKFPVYCRGLSIKGPTRARNGRINVSIVLGGSDVNPGDFIVGDRDGLVVVAAEVVDEVIKQSLLREAKEAALRERIERGDTTVALLGLDEILAKMESR